jgi:hypothetical protein
MPTMLGTWINIARSVFNATKIWVSDDPTYVEIRELMKADFQQNLVKPLRDAYKGQVQPNPKQVLLWKPLRILLGVLILLYVVLCFLY